MKKIIIAIFSVALFAFMAVSCEEPVPTPAPAPAPTPAPAPEEVQLESIVITPDTLNMLVGEVATAKFEITPSNFNGQLGFNDKSAVFGGDADITKDYSAKTITVKAKSAGLVKFAFGTKKLHSNYLVINISAPAPAPGDK